MIKDQINKQIAEALKQHDEIRLSTLRLLSSALNYEFIEKQRELTEEDELLVVKREIKRRKEAIDAYSKAGEKDRAEIEQKELAILEEFMPQQASQEEVESFVDQAIEKIGNSPSNFGLIMKEIMSKLGSRVDGALVARLVKEKLS